MLEQMPSSIGRTPLLSTCGGRQVSIWTHLCMISFSSGRSNKTCPALSFDMDVCSTSPICFSIDW